MKVYADIDISLDGYIAGPDISKEHPLGRGGEQLIWYGDDVNDSSTEFESVYAKNDAIVLEESAHAEGAVIMGQNTFDVSIESWGEDPPIHKPCFVLTNTPRPKLVRGDTSFAFVTTGVKDAIEQAITAAKEKDVCVMGGAYTIAECINAGLLDELHLHIVPVLLGDGLRLFDGMDAGKTFEKVRVLEGEKATHFVLREGKAVRTNSGVR